jgi:hypothetical protein
MSGKVITKCWIRNLNTCHKQKSDAMNIAVKF